MNVLVGTSVWSLALRRQKQTESKYTQELRALIEERCVQMIGPIRQELLSGAKLSSHFKKLKQRLAAFPDLIIETEVYEKAAEFFNICRSTGIQGSNTDFLICAVSAMHKLPIFTADHDFEYYTKHGGHKCKGAGSKG